MNSEDQTIQNISDKIRLNTYSESTVSALGSFINNQEFSKGFKDFQLGKDQTNAYIWKCLSAVSEDVGNTLYENVLHYVDYVSNVEVCKVKALKSMMKLFGFDYTIFTDFDKMPIEVQNLMNIVSIDKKYLLDDRKVSKAMIDDMLSAGALYHVYDRQDAYDGALNSVFSQDMSSDSNYKLKDTAIDEEKYFKYVVSLYYDLLESFCRLKYNISPDESQMSADPDTLCIYKTIGYELQNEELLAADVEIKNFKTVHNIPFSFNQSQIVDDIENDADSIDNYTYPEADLLKLEMQHREAKASTADLESSGYKLTRNADSTSRYTYYRKQKVKEYISFIDNKYFIDNLDKFYRQIYDLNPNYVELTTNESGLSSTFSVLNYTEDGWTLDDQKIEFIANSLAVATTYIVKLREKLKLQVRKNYMKGTQSLLLYIINEYLNDYANHKSRLLELDSSFNADEKSKANEIYDALRDNELEFDEKIVLTEYYDETEYFNLETESSISAEYGDQTNRKFFEEKDLAKADGLACVLQEIQKFYLSSCAMQADLSSNEMLADFLSAVFDLGADTSFIDKQTGLFTAKLSTYNRYTNDVYQELVLLSSTFAKFNAYISSDYTYPSAIISAQISNVLETYIFQNLSDEYLAHVSDVYNIYQPQLEEICANLLSLSQDYTKFLEEPDYQIYYVSSDYKYVTDSAGAYKHDFFNDNPRYHANEEYFLDRLNNYQNFLDDQNNILNHEFIDALDQISSNIRQLSDQYETTIVPKLQEYGFVDISALLLDDELKNGREFINDKINKRYAYLNGILNEIRQQTNNLKANLDNIKRKFAEIVATYDDGSGYSITNIGSPFHIISISNTDQSHKSGEETLCHEDFDGHCTASKPDDISEVVTDENWPQTCPDDGKVYYGLHAKGDKAKYERGNRLFKDYYFKHLYNPSDPFEERLLAVKEYINLPTALEAGYSKDTGYYLIGYYHHFRQNEGTDISIDELIQEYNDLKDTLHAIINQINYIGGEFDESAYESIEETLNALLEYVSTFDENNFNGDSQLVEYREILSNINAIETAYIPYKQDFKQFFNMQYQSTYFKDYPFGKDCSFKDFNDLVAYVDKTDSESRLYLEGMQNEFRSKLTQLHEDYYELTANLLEDAPDFTSEDSQYLEVELSNTHDFLLVDIDNKTISANAIIDSIKLVINGYMDILSNEISNSVYVSYQPFDECISDRIEYLYFFDEEQYMYKQSLFMTYAGRDFCYYPYQNYKNAAHPSYQVHPFLWNFVAKDSTLVSLLTKTYYSIRVEDLIGEKLRRNADKYFGEFGQSINKWMNPDIVDYSGYTTRYESSTHTTSRSQLTSEVIDYDGGFYPPAVQMMNEASACCMESLLSGVNTNWFYTSIKKALDADLTSYVNIVSEISGENETTVYKYKGDTSLYSIIHPIVSKYVVSSDISNVIDSYFIDAMSDYTLDRISKEQFILSVVNSLPKTFFEKYYQHIGIQDNAEQRKFLYEQLKEYYPSMLSTILADQPLENVYDIYKYGLDANNNMYLLYKQYGLASPTYKQRKNTSGSLWIRLNDYPFAFPAFTGKHPNVQMSRYDSINPLLRKLAGIFSEAQYQAQSNYVKDLPYFYDFEMSENGQNLYLVSKIRSEEVQDMDAAFQMYENPMIIRCQTKFESNTDIERLQIYDNTNVGKSASTEGLQSGENASGMSKLSAMPVDQPITNYAYIGSYIQGTDTVNFAYAEKSYLPDGKVELTKKLKVCSIRLGNYIPGQYDYTDVNGNDSSVIKPNTKLASDDMCIEYDPTTGYLTYAYLVEPTDALATSISKGIADLSSNTNGHIYSDPRSAEMNSHDVFDSNVAIVKTEMDGKTIKALPSNSRLYNTNADMSYVPAYPGLSGESFIYSSSLSSTKLLNVQLLGDSKNIDRTLALVNEHVDPYFDVNTIFDDYLFGRVYEDFVEVAEQDKFIKKSFNLHTNPSLNSNLEKYQLRQDRIKEYVWEVYLNDVEYTQKNKAQMKVLLYNTKTLGKNPYLITTLTKLTLPKDVYMSADNYNDEITSESSAEKQISSDTFTEKSYANVVGTYNLDVSMNQSDNNHIRNIQRIDVRYDAEINKIDVKFILDDILQDEITFIEEGSIQLLLYTDNDLDIFKYYHFLDEYGAVNSFYGEHNVPLDFYGDGWYFAYDKEKYDPGCTLCAMRAYYLDKDNNRQLLNSIDLTKYNYLSDIYILQGNERLSFKYGEEAVFDFNNANYYFPTMNVKYPKLAANYISDSDQYQYTRDNSNLLTHVFGDSNLFIFDLLEPNAVNDKIKTIEIPSTYDETECYRVFEKYEDNEDGSISAISDYMMYDVADSRVTKFMHFSEPYTVLSDSTLTPEEIKQQCAEYLSANPDTKTFISKLNTYLKITPQASEATSDKVAGEPFAFDVLSIDIKDLLKLYVNYTKTDNGIDLYFNYFNYFNTPFIKIENNKTYPDIIDSTYLKLQPNENGIISIIAQFKHYVGDIVYGYKNVTLATFQIFNVSDDKPKFMIQNMSVMKANDLLQSSENPNVTVMLQDAVIGVDGKDKSEFPVFNFDISIQPDQPLSQEQYTIVLDYPPDLVAYDPPENARNNGYYIPDNGVNGMLNVVVTNPAVRTVTVSMKMLKNIDQLAYLQGISYIVNVSVEGIMKNKAGLTAKVTCVNGSIRLSSNIVKLFAVNGQEDGNMMLLADKSHPDDVEYFDALFAKQKEKEQT